MCVDRLAIHLEYRSQLRYELKPYTHRQNFP
jgi:hypothetical protein